MSAPPAEFSLGVVRVYDRDSFLGTAVHLGNGCFLTCAHVVADHKALSVRSDSKAEPISVQCPHLDKDKALDVAVVKSDRNQAGALPILTWLKGVQMSSAAEVASAVAIGYPGEFSGQCGEFAPRSAEVSRCDPCGVVLDYSLSKGVPEGYSGGPLVIVTSAGIRGIGLIQLGGRDRALTVARAIDPILKWLQSKGIAIETVAWSSEFAGPVWPQAVEELRHGCQTLADDLSRVPIQSIHRGGGATGDSQKRLLLADVYVELETEEKRTKNRVTRSGGWVALEADSTDEPKVTLIQSIMNHRRLVVLGLPGSGKSSFFNTIARKFALEWLGNGAEADGLAWFRYAQPPIPLLLSIRQFAGRQNVGFEANAALLRTELELFLKKRCVSRAVDDLDRGLRLGRFIVLLDGLDEAPPDRRSAIRDCIREFARVFPRTAVVVTCRVRTYENRDCDCALNDFETVRIAPLSRGLREEFIDKYFARSEWLRTVGEGDGLTLASSLKEAVGSSEALAEMAETPMMLNLMAGLHGQRRLPDNRAEVYQTLVEGLLDDLGKPGHDGKSLILQKLESVGSDRNELKSLLAELSFQIHEAELRAGSTRSDGKLKSAPSERFIRKNDLEIKLLELGDPKIPRLPRWAREFCKDIEERAGLLIAVNDAHFKFPHRSFQEFFAGMHIAQPRTLAKQGRELLDGGEHWQEVVRWAAGYMADVSGFLEEVVRLLTEIIEPSDADGNELPKNIRSLLIAAEIARETGTVRLRKQIGGKDCLKKLSSALVAQFLPGKTIPAAARIPFGSALGWVGDERLGVGVVSVSVGEGRLSLPRMDWLPVQQRPGRGKPANPPPFWIAKYAVTVEQYDAFLRANPKHPKPHDYSRVYQTPNHPRVGVDWEDAGAFANWLSLQIFAMDDKARVELGLPLVFGHGNHASGEYCVRLPHESEWQAAAAGPDGFEYPWSNAEPTDQHCNFDGNVGHTTPVGSYPPGASPCGAEEMAGNVWEWCLDEYGGDDKFSASRRVVRGGGWKYPAASCRCACRLAYHPGFRNEDLGFRLVLAPVPPGERSERSGARNR